MFPQVIIKNKQKKNTKFRIHVNKFYMFVQENFFVTSFVQNGILIHSCENQTLEFKRFLYSGVLTIMTATV